MNKYVSPSLFILSFFTAFWAYTIIDTQLREFSSTVTFIDLAVLFILGFIGGIPAGIALISFTRKKASIN